MGAYNCAVWHDVFHISIIAEVVEHVIEDTMVTPAGETLVHTVPFAILGRKRAPLCSCARYPQRCFDEATTFRFVTDINTRVFPQKRQYFLPLVIS